MCKAKGLITFKYLDLILFLGWHILSKTEPVVILCGGKGTRLREETEFKPKALVEIGGKPILYHVMEHYSKFGYNNFILALGYMGDRIREDVLHMRDLRSDMTLRLGTQGKTHYNEPSYVGRWIVTFVDTGQETPTGGRLKLAESYVKTRNFLVTYCDGLSDVNLHKLYQQHIRSKKTGTLTAVHPASPFGTLQVSENLNVDSFKEKPRLDGLINGGFFVFNRDIFRTLRRDSVLEEEVLRSLASNGKLGAYVHNGYWECMDTFKQVESLNRAYAASMAERGKTPWQ